MTLRSDERVRADALERLRELKRHTTFDITADTNRRAGIQDWSTVKDEWIRASDLEALVRAGGVERTPAKETENESAISTQDAIRNESDERLAGSGRPHQQVGGAERRQRREQDHRADQDRGVASAQEVARGAVEPPAQEPLSRRLLAAEQDCLLYSGGRLFHEKQAVFDALLLEVDAALRGARPSPPPATPQEEV